MKRVIFIHLLFTMLLSACGSSQPALTATSLPTNAPIPTSTETPIPSIPMIEIDGVKVPDPKVSNPELFDLKNPDSPIVQFANAFGVKPEEVGSGLHAEFETPSALPSFVVLRTSDGVALIMAQQGENGELKWVENTPGLYFHAYGKNIGAFLDGADWTSDVQQKLEKYFRYGGIIALNGQVRPGGTTEAKSDNGQETGSFITERRPSRAAGYLSFAKENQNGFFFHYVVEPGKFPHDVTTGKRDVDDWLFGQRIPEMFQVIKQNKPDQPVYLVFNEAYDISSKWNRDLNPLEKKYRDGWIGEYLYQTLLVASNEGLKPNTDFIFNFTENQMYNLDKQNAVHEALIKGREDAFNKLDDQTKIKLGITSPEDTKIVLGVETHVDLDAPNTDDGSIIPVPSIERVNQLADRFGDLGGVLFDLHFTGDAEKQQKFLRELQQAAINNKNISAVLFFNMFNERSGRALGIPDRLFDSEGNPTQLFYELLREGPSN